MDYKDLIDPLIKKRILVPTQGSHALLCFNCVYPDDALRRQFLLDVGSWNGMVAVWKGLSPEDLPLWIAAHGSPCFLSNGVVLDDVITWAAQCYLERECERVVD